MNQPQACSKFVSSLRPIALATIGLSLALVGCESPQSTELVPGEQVAHAAGKLLRSQAATSLPKTRAVAVWNFWPEDQCEYAHDEYDSVSCSGALLATEATLVAEDGQFSVDLVEAPPAYVHGRDVALAEAFIAIVADDADLATIDFTNPDQTVGIVRDFVIVYAPSDFGENTVEAATVGSPIGAGFHTVKVLIDEDGNYTGEQYNVILEDGSEVISIQTGELTSEANSLVVEPGELNIPWLGL